MTKTKKPASTESPSQNRWQALNEARIKAGQLPLSPIKTMDPPLRQSSQAIHCQKQDCIVVISNGSPKR